MAKGFKLAPGKDPSRQTAPHDFGAIFDKAQVVIYTEPKAVDEVLAQARAIYGKRDARIEGMTDEDHGYLLLLHPLPIVCPQPRLPVVSPERTGLCGAYNSMDRKAACEINPTGPNQPIPKGRHADPETRTVGRAPTTL